jgi:hypothetical protein
MGLSLSLSPVFSCVEVVALGVQVFDEIPEPFANQLHLELLTPPLESGRWNYTPANINPTCPPKKKRLVSGEPRAIKIQGSSSTFLDVHFPGAYILENTPPPGGGGNADVIWGKKYEKAKRKSGKYKRKRKK